MASFCCDNCRSEGITGIAEDACCKIHSHDNEEIDHPESDMDSACDVYKTHCTITRIAYDWDSSNNSTFKCEPDCFKLIKVILPDNFTVYSPIIHYITSENSTGPPSLCPRAYLSFLTVLLI
jgi:hypothetical protein